MLPSDFKVIKCPKCSIVAIKLITKIPLIYKQKYPEGVCRKCKKICIIELRSMLIDKSGGKDGN